MRLSNKRSHLDRSPRVLIINPKHNVVVIHGIQQLSPFFFADATLSRRRNSRERLGEQPLRHRARNHVWPKGCQSLFAAAFGTLPFKRARADGRALFRSTAMDGTIHSSAVGGSTDSGPSYIETQCRQQKRAGPREERRACCCNNAQSE